MSYAFDFSLSFSSECRKLAMELSGLLVQRGAKVFYDESYLKHLFGKRLDDEFAGKFGGETRFFVPFVSCGYAQKPWPQYEWSVASSESHRRDEEFILPLRVDDTCLIGLSDAICYLDLRTMELVEVADVLIAKLGTAIDPSEGEPEDREWVATFGMRLETIEEDELSESAPSDFPMLYDWLTEDLLNQLSRTSMSDVQVLEDLRNGECLSVRLGFEWDLSKEALNFGDMGSWELLELAPYNEFYER